MRQLFLLLSILTLPLFANPFLPPAGDAPKADTVKQEPQKHTVSVSQKAPFLREIVAQQKKLHEKLSTLLLSLKESFQIKHLALLLFIAFVYGIIHSLGPGHAKVLIGSRLISGKEGKKDAVVAGAIFAFTHTGIALLLFTILHLILKLSSSSSDAIAANLLKTSGWLIIATAIYLFWDIIHDLKKESEEEHSDNSKKSLNLLAFIAGITPCPGALLILIFSNLLGIALYGVLAVIAVSLGMALTVSLIALSTVAGRDIASKQAEKVTFLTKLIPVVRILSTLVVLAIGISFL